MGDFTWFWFLLIGLACFLVAIGELMARQPWRFEFHETNSLLICTPWGGFELAHEGFDPCEYRRWTGVKVWRRVSGTMDVETPGIPGRLRNDYMAGAPVFKTVYKHEMLSQPWQ